MAYLYVLIDESGNYDFSPRGTTYWVLTSVMTTDINSGVMELHELKHRLIDRGVDVEYFHAAKDRQMVRDQVFSILAKLSDLRADSVVVEKKKAAPSIRPLYKFYPMMVEGLLKYPFDPRGIDVRNYEKVFIFLDRAHSRASTKDALKAAIKTYLARHLRGVPYVICMHSSASHPYLQIVDYVSWAIYVKRDRGEVRPYGAVRHLLKSEFEIFKQGSVDWY